MSFITKNLNQKILAKNLATLKSLKDRMGLRMKNFNIMWFTKDLVYRGYRGEGHEKLICRRILHKRGGGLGQFADLRVGGREYLTKKRGEIEGAGWGGGVTPIHTMNLAVTSTVILIY